MADSSGIARILNNRNLDEDCEAIQALADYFGSRHDDTDSECEDSSDIDDSIIIMPDNEPEPDFTITTDLSNAVLPFMETGAPGTVAVKESKGCPCSCQLFDGNHCHTFFKGGELEELRMEFIALERAELDMVILSKIDCGIHLSEFTNRSNKKSQTERKAARTDFFYHGQRICRETFLYMHGISREKLTTLINHYKSNGVTPRQHKNSKRLPSNSFSFSDRKKVVDFIVGYAGDHAIMLPGRTPHNWVSDVKLLPTNCTKKTVYDVYVRAVTQEHRVVSYRSFRRIWGAILPFIRTMPPASDLCLICQQDAAKLSRARHQSVEEKTALVRNMEKHLLTVTAERSYFKCTNDAVKNALPSTFTDFRSSAPCSFDGTVHYSFDFAQQIQYPSDPLQPGPIYFKSPRKCGLFGIHCEAIGRQMNYLIDEACSPGKGADCIISLFHHFLEHYGFGETHLHIHADNCSGQNKNNAMMFYLLWRVLTGRHREIKMSFLITGHTKFSPDWCFGLIKKRLRRTKVDSLGCIESVVNECAKSNTAHVVGPRPEEASLQFFKWTEFLTPFFKKVKDIKKYHHFQFTEAGLSVKEFADSPASRQEIMKPQTPPHGFPAAIRLPGLDFKRQKYLFDEIRPFVSDEFKDVVCPEPIQQTADAVLAVSDVNGPTDVSAAPPRGKPAPKRRKR